jgi:Contact-dependent growth inhibition CdiA C-terminal domain
MVLVPIGSGTTTSASDAKQDSRSAVSDAWKGAFDKAQSERSSSLVNPTTIADIILPPEDLKPPPTEPMGPFGTGPGGWSVEPPTEPMGPFGTGPGGWSVEPPTEPTGPFGTGPGGWSVEPPTEPTGPFGTGPGGWSVEPPTEPMGPFGTGPGGWSVEPPGTFPDPHGTEPMPPTTGLTPLWVNYAKGPEPPKVEELPDPDPNKKGELTGEPEEPHGTRQQQEGIKLQNESGVILTEHGVNVEYLPKTNLEHQSSPDLKINDPTPTTGAKGKQQAFNAPNHWETADVKSPESNNEKQIAQDIEDAHKKQGVDTVVVNLSRTKVTAKDLVRYLRNPKNHPKGVNTVYVISKKEKGNQTVTRLSWPSK